MANTALGMIHLRGDTKEVNVPIHGKTVIQKGELIFIGLGASRIVGTPNDAYGYPARLLADVTNTYFTNSLIGVSMKASPSGTTEDIRVATAGIFRAQDMRRLTGSQTARVGYLVAAATHYSGVSVSGVSVVVGPVFDSCIVGQCIKSESGCSTVDFMLLTKFSGASVWRCGN